jgi:hypothetical protein
MWQDPVSKREEEKEEMRRTWKRRFQLPQRKDESP